MSHVHNTFIDTEQNLRICLSGLRFTDNQRTLWTSPSLLCMQILDAVVCDPPYGVRAGGRKSQCKPDLQVRDRTTHITSTAPYSMGALSFV